LKGCEDVFLQPDTKVRSKRRMEIGGERRRERPTFKNSDHRVTRVLGHNLMRLMCLHMSVGKTVFEEWPDGGGEMRGKRGRDMRQNRAPYEGLPAIVTILCSGLEQGGKERNPAARIEENSEVWEQKGPLWQASPTRHYKKEGK